MPEALLEVTELTKRYGGILATDGATLSIARGEVHALIGPNGAGKTTLVNEISGAVEPDAGTIRFEGLDITSTPMHARVAEGISRSWQVTSLFDAFSAIDNVALAVRARTGSGL